MTDSKRKDKTLSLGIVQSEWAKNHLVLLPGNAIFLNSVTKTANREIGVPENIYFFPKRKTRPTVPCRLF